MGRIGAPCNPGKRTDLECTVGLLCGSGGDLQHLLQEMSVRYESWVWFLGLCPNGWDFQGVGFFGLSVGVGPPGVGTSPSATEMCF